MVMAPPPRMTQQYRLASTAAWLSSTGLSHHNLLPHIPSTRPSSQQQPSAWGCSTIPKHQLPAAAPSTDLSPCPGNVWLWQGLSDSHSI